MVLQPASACPSGWQLTWLSSGTAARDLRCVRPASMLSEWAVGRCRAKARGRPASHRGGSRRGACQGRRGRLRGQPMSSGQHGNFDVFVVGPQEPYEQQERQ
jgi:hypothetical protein